MMSPDLSLLNILNPYRVLLSELSTHSVRKRSGLRRAPYRFSRSAMPQTQAQQRLQRTYGLTACGKLSRCVGGY